jgi:hypothetical protein
MIQLHTIYSTHNLDIHPPLKLPLRYLPTPLALVAPSKYVVLYIRYLQRNTKKRGSTLAARGLEELFFPVVLLCHFFGSGWKWVLVLHTYILRVQYSCGVVLVFWFWRKIVFGVTYVLSVQYSCAVESVLWLWQEIVLKMRTPFDFLWAVSTNKYYWVTLFWSASRCVYFVGPNTLLLCIFLFCIFLLYCADPQVDVQIRILLKDKYVKSCQNANTGNHTMISCTQFLRIILFGFLNFTETTRQPRYVSHNILTFYYCVSLSCIVWIYRLTVTIVSQKISRTFFASRN